jgi:hypothetical protein
MVDLLLIIVAVPGSILGLLLGLDLIEGRPRRKTGTALLAPHTRKEQRAIHRLTGRR